MPGFMLMKQLMVAQYPEGGWHDLYTRAVTEGLGLTS
jgi:hypothetical protein